MTNKIAYWFLWPLFNSSLRRLLDPKQDNWDKYQIKDITIRFGLIPLYLQVERMRNTQALILIYFVSLEKLGFVQFQPIDQDMREQNCKMEPQLSGYSTTDRRREIQHSIWKM